jgi:hypothetical protein
MAIPHPSRLNRKQRRELTRRLRSADPGLDVIHPNAAGIDVGNSAHYVAVRPDRDRVRLRSHARPPTDSEFPQPPLGGHRRLNVFWRATPGSPPHWSGDHFPAKWNSRRARIDFPDVIFPEHTGVHLMAPTLWRR